jgi:putative spermidine/putrescine transport system permease protein
MNAYATPVLLGGPRFQMMAPLIYNQTSEQANWPLGGALAFVLMSATLLITAIRSAAGYRTDTVENRGALRVW